MVEDRVGWLVGSGPGRRHTTIGAPGAGRRAELARSWHWSPHLAAAGDCWWLGGGTTRHQAAGSQQLAPVLSRPWRNAVSSRAEHVM